MLETTIVTGVALFAAAVAVPEIAAEPTPAHAGIIDEIRAHRSGLAIWWVGNTGWLVKADGVLVGIDLDLDSSERIAPPPVTAEELAGEIDVAFATHHHGDHFDATTLAKIAATPRCTFVLPRTCLAGAAAAGIPRERIVVPAPLVPFEVKGVRVRPLHARPDRPPALRRVPGGRREPVLDEGLPGRAAPGPLRRPAGALPQARDRGDAPTLHGTAEPVPVKGRNAVGSPHLRAVGPSSRLRRYAAISSRPPYSAQPRGVLS